LALSMHDAPQASSIIVSRPDDSSSEPHRAGLGRTRRLGASLVAAAAIALLGAMPVSAAWPVATRHSYVSQFAHRTHMAIDIAAPRGTRLVPIGSGRVVFAGWRSNCGGYQVWVKHPHGIYTAYYHMSRETSHRGEWVTGQSTTLGYVGATGCATGPHVHVEVWRGYPWRSGSYRINPWRFIDKGHYEPSRYR
jgi:murein DD-endopeptidase MepM/ murein hydrolase activator NlpD